MTVQRFYDALIRDHRKRTVVGVIITFIVLNMLFVFAESAWRIGSNLVISATPASAYFEYRAINYVTNDDKSITFASNSIVKQTYPTKFNDILRCSTGNEYSFFSSYNSSSDAPVVRTEYKTILWDYNAPFPSGRVCLLESTITMDVNGYPKVQKLESQPFEVK